MPIGGVVIMRLMDLTGQRFGRLSVIRRDGRIGNSAAWLCKCDCGNESVVRGECLRSGVTKSCGCLRRDAARKLAEDLTGRRFGSLTVVRRSESRRKGASWICECDCGNEVDVFAANLKRGFTTSCGCMSGELISKAKRTHGESSSRLYRVFYRMVERCENPEDISFQNYGGRGIRVCDEWRHDFSRFRDWAMSMGYDPDAPRGECTIDRIDVNGDYCPENCRWIPMSEQNRNRRDRRGRAVVQVDRDGSVIGSFVSMKQAERSSGTSYSAIRNCCIGESAPSDGTLWRFAE